MAPIKKQKHNKTKQQTAHIHRQIYQKLLTAMSHIFVRLMSITYTHRTRKV